MKQLSIIRILKFTTVTIMMLLGLRPHRTAQPTTSTSTRQRHQSKIEAPHNIILLGVVLCGLTLIWFVIPSSQPASAASIFVVASGANIGASSAINVINNKTVVTYTDTNLRDLFIVLCTNPVCSLSTTRTLDTNAHVAGMSIAAVGNNPIVVYADTSLPRKIKTAACVDSQCSSAPIINMIATNTGVGSPSIVVVGGLPVISYYDGDTSTGVLKVAACSDAACNAFTTTTVDSSSTGVGLGTSMAIGSSGNPIISYVDYVNNTLKVAFCSTATCSASTITTILGTGSVHYIDTSITILNGNPIISYATDFGYSGIHTVACLNLTCTTPYVVTTIDSVAGEYNSITNLGGIVVVAYGERIASTWDLKMARCDNPNCTARTLFYLDTAFSVGIAPQIASFNGLPVISYYDETYDAIKVYYGGDLTAFTSPTPTQTPLLTNTSTPTETATTLPLCSGFKAVNVRFSADRVLVDLVNNNSAPTTLERVVLNWQTLGSFPSMSLNQMEMNGEAHWTGMDTSPPTSTDVEPTFNAGANRTIPAYSTVTWSAQFVNGPTSLADFMTRNNFLNSGFYFYNSNIMSVCPATLVNTVPTATPTVTYTPMSTYTSSPTRTPTQTPSGSPTSTMTPTATFTPSVTPTPSQTPVSTLITENEFFEALVEARQGYPDIITIVPDFVPNAINMTIAVTGGTVGNVSVTMTQGQGFVAFDIASITVNGTPAPTSYVNIINRDLPAMLTTALDHIMNTRFGGVTNVHTLTLSNDAIIVTLNSQ